MDKLKTNNEMADLIPTALVITLDINGLNTQFKDKTCQNDLKRKKDQDIYDLYRICT